MDPAILAIVVVVAVFGLIGVLFLIGSLFGLFFTVDQQTAAIVERFGKYVATRGPGLKMKIPLIERVAARVPLRLQQFDVPVDTMSEEETSVKPIVAVQYLTPIDKAADAYYKLQNPQAQITSFVQKVVRAKVPNIKLMDLFKEKEEIATEIETGLKELISDFGYEIVKAFVVDIEIDPKVREAMNKVNEMRRLALAAEEEAKLIEALERGKGAGVRAQRIEIAHSIVESFKLLKAELPEGATFEALLTLLTVQYYDMLEKLGASGKVSTIMLPSGPNGALDTITGMRDAITSGAIAAKNATEGAR